MFLLGRVPLAFPNRSQLIIEVLEKVLNIDDSEKKFAKDTIALLYHEKISPLESEIFEHELTKVSKDWNQGNNF